MYPSKIVILKGKSVKKDKKWIRTEFTIEMVLTEGDNIEQAKAVCDVLLESWLRKER